MNATATSIILAASIVLEVILELHGNKVPAIVYLLSGFAVRHIIGGDTATNSAPVPSQKVPSAAPLAVLLLILCFSAMGCFSAGVSGTGVNVQDSAHMVDVQANSFNAEVNSDAR